MRTYQIISADGHVEVPADRLTAYIPEKHRDKAPTLVTKDDGTEWWRLGEWERNSVGNLVCDLPYDEFVSPTGARYHNMDGSLRPGTGSGAQRLREQDIDGIDAEVLYPPVYMGSFIRLLAAKDVEAYKSIVRAYNTYLAEEYCSVAPDRLIGNAMVLETGIDDAIEEMKRCKDMGLRSVSLRLWPNGGDDYLPEDDRFFAASLDMDMKLSPHANFGGPAMSPPNSVGVTPRFVLRMGANSGGCMATIGDLVYNGVFDRYPALRFYFAETQGGWLPHSMNWADEFFIRWYSFYDLKLDRLPSEYIREHCRFSFIADRLAMQFRHYVGLDLLMWGSDFPHSVGTYPNSKEVIEELFDGVPEKERRQVLVDNVCDFFDLDRERELTPTPA
jgi:predicted TIM-barrel fold metal-dependent hydrolase